MSRLLDVLSRLPAGASTLTPAQVAWLACELETEGLKPAQGGVWRVWELDLEGAHDERATVRITLHERGLSGSALVQRGERHVDESDETFMAAPFQSSRSEEVRARKTNGGRVIAQEMIARAQQIKRARG